MRGYRGVLGGFMASKHNRVATMMAPTFIHRPVTRHEDVTNSLVKAIAVAEGCDPTELDLIINDYVSTDTIEEFLADSSHHGYLSFEVEEYQLLVFSTGDIVVFG